MECGACVEIHHWSDLQVRPEGHRKQVGCCSQSVQPLSFFESTQRHRLMMHLEEKTPAVSPTRRWVAIVIPDAILHTITSHLCTEWELAVARNLSLEQQRQRRVERSGRLNVERKSHPHWTGRWFVCRAAFCVSDELIVSYTGPCVTCECFLTVHTRALQTRSWSCKHASVNKSYNAFLSYKSTIEYYVLFIMSTFQYTQGCSYQNKTDSKQGPYVVLHANADLEMWFLGRIWNSVDKIG